MTAAGFDDAEFSQDYRLEKNKLIGVLTLKKHSFFLNNELQTLDTLAHVNMSTVTHDHSTHESF